MVCSTTILYGASIDFQVRELGRILNIPVGFLKRHPFPGPGLAVRIPGDVTEGNALDILRQVDEKFFNYKSVSKYICK